MAEQTRSAVPPRPAAMRAERDRFVALAFCWADFLIELDAREMVVFAAGPTEPLIGRAPSDLVGSPFHGLIAGPDRSLVRELFGIARKRGRIENVSVRLQGAEGITAPLAVAGYRLDDLAGHYFLAFRVGAHEGPPAAAGPATRDAACGLYDCDSFNRVISPRVQAADEAGEESCMTLIALPGYASLQTRLEGEAEQNLLNTVGAYLKANAVDGDTAARIGDDRFGLLHRRDLDVEELERTIGGFAREADPAGQGVAVESATIAVDSAAVSEEDIANGLVYAINRFRNAEGRDFSIKQLSTNLSSLVSQAVRSVNSFKQVVAGSDFDVALQPIIDVMTGQIHHFEALARFRAPGRDPAPYEYITFAEETGLIQDFDLAMAHKVVEWLGRTPRNSTVSVAVNVSGRSVGSVAYMTGIHELLRANLWARGRLLFEITESARLIDLAAANQFIQNLRNEGFAVCLDDFGAGAANFQYLSTMVVDVVKLDGSAVRHAQTAQKGKAFLKALVGLCRDLGVGTIAEMVDDERGLHFIRECGVQYVQGYLFGKPSKNVRDFAKMRPRHLFPGWRDR